MIPKECKRLAEVDFPIAVVSKHSAREKSIRHGHPSTLHLWWARRPLAACRSMLMALLLPDPCDDHCPAEFKEKARALLPDLVGEVGSKDIDLRKSLLRFIGDFANWDHSNHPKYLEVSRGLVKAAHPEETPLVVDPFAGGGSIPLEALRIGCDAFASDLNPVACLILKVMLEDIPRHGPRLAEELRRVGGEIKKRAEKELAEFYPKDPDGATPIAYLWARSVRCDEPDCGATIPLIRTAWLAARKNKSGAYTKLVSVLPTIEETLGELHVEIDSHSVPTRQLPLTVHGTIKNGKATCIKCGRTMSATRVKSQLIQQMGGSSSSAGPKPSTSLEPVLLAVILRTDHGVQYRLPTKEDHKALSRAAKKASEMRVAMGADVFPTEPINPIRPSPNARGVSGATRIGITDFGRLFTDRQKIALRCLLDLSSAQSESDGSRRAVGLAVTKLAERCSSFVTWINSTEAPRGTFARQALTIAWDFIELIPVASNEEYLELIESMANAADSIARGVERVGQAEQASATHLPLADDSAHVIFTDPPYYDSIPYADLSDYFLIWLKRGDFLPSSVILDKNTGLSPKVEECVWDQAHMIDGVPKSPEFFEEKIAAAFVELRRTLNSNGVASVVFAHKSTEGWEALLSGMIKAGLCLSASWPIATERAARLNAKEAASLATSVHLICRPRSALAGTGDWGKVLRELPTRVGDWMERLQSEGVRGADLVFACIGPALEIYSRYSTVVDPEEREVPLGGDPAAKEPHKRGYLSYVWEVVGRMALEQVLGTDEAKARNGAAGALEEDARLTALFLWTLQSTSGNNGSGSEQDDDGEPEDDDEDSGPKSQPKGFSLIFDVVRRFAQPLGIELPRWEDRIIKTEKGVVRLLPVSERAKQLFGEDGARAVADWIVNDPVKNLQQVLFPDEQFAQAPKIRGRAGRSSAARQGKIELDPAALDADRKHEATTLDRVHAAMLLQAGGQTNALRALLKAEQDRGPDFLRLANSLTPLYPVGSEERRLLEAMLQTMPR